VKHGFNREIRELPKNFLTAKITEITKEVGNHPSALKEGVRKCVASHSFVLVYSEKIEVFDLR
jgi:hypothetical protein